MKPFLMPIAAALAALAVPALAQQATGTAPADDVVMVVEQRLQDLGYSVTPDGQFDADLRNSVMLFQSDYGLRPTGNVDLVTLDALGIEVEPTGGVSTALVQPEPGDQMAMLPPEQDQVAMAEQPAAVDDGSVDYPLLKDEHMSAPQIGGDARHDRFENFTGVPQPFPALVAEIPGIEPGFPEENLN